MTQKRIEQKVVAIIAESSPIAIVDTAREIMQCNRADILKLRLDCLESQYQTEKTVEGLREALPNYALMISVRNIKSVPETRIATEGFKSGKHDLDRIALLRKAAEVGAQYFELEHEFRRNFFLGGAQPAQVVILHTNLSGTPAPARLNEIYADILRQGADHIVLETLVQDKNGDKGQEDRNNLLTLAKTSLNLKHSKPLTIIGRGKYGKNLNLEMYQQGIVPFVYGVVPSYSFIPLLGRKRAHQEMPTLAEVTQELKRY